MASSGKFHPFIIGSGNAGKAMAKALAVVGIVDEELQILPPTFVKRGESLEALRANALGEPVLFIANPHGLHASFIQQGAKAGFSAIVCDKPVAVRAEEISALRSVETPVSVCHGYRMLWGPQTIRQKIETGELGELIALEGRYWQSSAAEKARTAKGPSNSWKNSIPLNGMSDTLVDLGAHWVDMAFFLMGSRSVKAEGWVSYVNAEASHRDTHAHLTLQFSGQRRAIASISKTFHGMGNHLEICVLGSRLALTWRFLEPDVLEIGQGSERRFITRANTQYGSGQPPFHALGWLEGYTEIIHHTLLKLAGRPSQAVPTLKENLDVMETLLSAELSL